VPLFRLHTEFLLAVSLGTLGKGANGVPKRQEKNERSEGSRAWRIQAKTSRAISPWKFYRSRKNGYTRKALQRPHLEKNRAWEQSKQRFTRVDLAVRCSTRIVEKCPTLRQNLRRAVRKTRKLRPLAPLVLVLVSALCHSWH